MLVKRFEESRFSPETKSGKTYESARRSNLQRRIFVSISHRIIFNSGLDSVRLADDHDRIAEMIHWITLTESGCLLIDLVQRKVGKFGLRA